MEGEPKEMNYDEPVEWPDSDKEEGSSSLVEVSEPTKRLLKTKFTVSLNNEKRKRAKGKFPKQPKVAAVKTPKLDDSCKQTGGQGAGKGAGCSSTPSQLCWRPAEVGRPSL